MEEGRVYTHGTLSAVRQRSDRAGTLQRLPNTEHLVKRTARASALSHFIEDTLSAYKD